MAIRRTDKLEFRYYEIPQSEPVLALLGRSWVRNSGCDVDYYHFHNLMEIGYCLRGTGDMAIDYEVSRYGKDTFTFIPHNMPHDTYSDEDETNFWEYLFIDVESSIKNAFPEDPQYAQEIVHAVNSRGGILKAADDPSAAWIIRSTLEIMRERRDYYQESAREMITALLLQIAGINNHAANKESRSPVNCSQITSALDYIADYYYEDIKIPVLADICHLSETHFRRVFHESMNMTPIDYVNLVRIQMACEIMSNSNETMTGIAQQVGYTAISTFNRNFKRFVGVSPYQWKSSPESYERKLLNVKIAPHCG